MKKIKKTPLIIGVIAALFMGPTLLSAQPIKGVVFEDRNTNKLFDKTEQGLANVIVSDGYSVVRTDAKGVFELPPETRSRFVFVTTPSGKTHSTPFYTTRKEGNKYEFGLKDSGKINAKFIHLSDTEATIYKDWVDDLKAYVKTEPVDFMVFSGDICYERGLNFHKDNITDSTMNTRMVYTLGNHDLMKTVGDYPEQLFEQLFGPVWYSFDVGGVHFVTLPVTYGDKTPSYQTDDIYNWLRKDLQAQPKDKPVVLFCHFLLPNTDDFTLKTAAQTLSLLDYNTKAWFYGHWHNSMYQRNEKTGVESFSSMSPNKGGIDHTPASFRVVSFDEKGVLQSKTRVANVQNQLVVNLFSQDKQQVVVAEAYDCTSEVTALWLECDGTWQPMTAESSWSWRSAVKNTQTPTKVRAEFRNGNIIIKEVPQKSRIQWMRNVGGNTLMSSPVVTDNAIYVASVDDDKALRCGISAIDKATGKLLWHYKTGNSIKNNMAYENGTLLACDVESIVYAIDAKTGTLKWKHALDKTNLQPYYSQGICVADGVVYAGQGVSLAALSTADGTPLWKNSAWKGGVVSVPTNIVEGEVLLTAAYWTGRFAHHAKTGALLWEKRDDDTRNCDGSPTVYGGHFFYTSPNYLFEVDPLTGQELQRVKLSHTLLTVSKPLVTDSLVVLGTADNGVVALDRKNSYKERWNFKTNPTLFYTVPYTKDFQKSVESGCALYKGDVYFGAGDGFVYCIEAATGRFKWRENLGSPILSNVVVDGGFLFVNDFAGNLVKLNIDAR